jgi:K+-transporting ATPase KdpF subunit
VIAVTDLDNWIALGIAGLGVVYLFVVLLHPERF